MHYSEPAKEHIRAHYCFHRNEPILTLANLAGLLATLLSCGLDSVVRTASIELIL